MAVLLDCSWAEIEAWRADYRAWHRRVTGRLVTDPRMPWERRTEPRPEEG